MSFTRTDLDTWLRGFAALVKENRGYLTELDSAIGDADHGSNLDRGMSAVVSALPGEPSLGAAMKRVGMTLVSNVGGASGPLFGTFFMKLGGELGDAEAVDGAQLAAGIQAGIDGVSARGKSTAGEKTMLDALIPAVEALTHAEQQDSPLPEALRAAAAAAGEGQAATADMVATKGRASYLGERSRGHLDPGATSVVYLFESLAAAVE